ncbi:MAG: hypothetical protein DWP92_04175 [Armatimonadetes bacterium]|nr:MAG: hypothetical protein DWP92_04175 [Armatimonadota bacterium]
MDGIREAIRREWGWAMPEPDRVLTVNKFGNVLVAAADGSLWRICPEELSCEQISGDVGGGGFQDSCRLSKCIHAACEPATTGFGLSLTSSTRDQSRVLPVHRSGWRALAAA